MRVCDRQEWEGREALSFFFEIFLSDPFTNSYESLIIQPY
nr:MAG TPA: hypothetical protein [Caudoviricetes sp.]